MYTQENNKIKMSLCNDVYQVILKNTDKTTLLVCKCVCKQFSLWVNEINPKLSWNIVDIIDNNYHHLYTNWIVPNVGPWQIERNPNTNIDYYIGKVCSYEFLQLFKESINIEDVMWGAMGSGNLQYIMHLCDNYKSIKYETVLIHFGTLLTSRSIKCVRYLISKFPKLKNLSQVDCSRIDLKENSKGDDPWEFVEYILKTFPKSNKRDLLINVSGNNSKLIMPLKKLGHRFNIDCLLAAVKLDNKQSIELIDNNFAIDKSKPLEVGSVNIYNLLKSRGYLIDEDETMRTAIFFAHTELISVLLKDGYIPTEEIIAGALDGLTNTSGIQYLIDAGVEITGNIYELANNGDIPISAPILRLLHKNGVPWTTTSVYFVAQTNDIEFIKSAVSAGCEIPVDLLTNRDLYKCDIKPTTFQYLIELGCTISDNVLHIAIDNGLLDLMPIICKHIHITMDHIKDAATEGCMDSLEIMVEAYALQRIREHVSHN